MALVADIGTVVVELVGRILGAPAHGSRDVVIFVALVAGTGCLALLWRLQNRVHRELSRWREQHIEAARVDELKIKVDDVSSKLNTEFTNLSQQLQKYSKKVAALEEKISKQPMRLELDNGESSLEERILAMEQRLHMGPKKEVKAEEPAKKDEAAAEKKSEKPEKKEPEVSPWLQALDKSRRRLHDQLMDLLKQKQRLGKSFPDAVRDVLNEHGLAVCWNNELEALLLAAPDNDQNTSELGVQIESILARTVSEALKVDTSAGVLPANSSQRPRIIMVTGSGGSERLEVSAELAQFLKRQGAKVLLGDCNSSVTKHRDNLISWGERAGVPVLTGAARAKPGSIAYRSIHKAQDEHFDTVILHAPDASDKADVEQWQQMQALIQREHPGAPHETFLIDNLNDKRNGKAPTEITPTGLIITGFDLSDHGGLLVSRAAEFKLPVRYVVITEPKRRIHPFSSSEFAAALCLGAAPESKEKDTSDAPKLPD